jgi:hypothetical protein
MKIIFVCSEGQDRPDGGGIFVRQLVNALAEHELFSVTLKIGSSSGVQHRGPSGLEIGLRGSVRGLGKLERLHKGLARQLEWNVIRPLQLRSRLATAVSHIAQFRGDAIFGIITSMESIVILN